VSGESAAAKSPLSGEVWRRSAIIHRTVQWCVGLSGEPTVGWANGRPRNPRVTRGRANDQMGAPDSVRCANGSKTATAVCASYGRKSGTGQCPVRQPTEGKICLPRLLPTAPRPLVPIKGTPRRLKQVTSAANKCRHHSDQFSLSPSRVYLSSLCRRQSYKPLERGEVLLRARARF
jgi:hypothetical protein